MNDLAREKLVEAALNGQKQIRGKFDDGKGGKCALGVLGYTSEMLIRSELTDKYEMRYGITNVAQCELCREAFKHEVGLVAHLNDKHGLDFLAIARKMP